MPQAVQAPPSWGLHSGSHRGLSGTGKGTAEILWSCCRGTAGSCCYRRGFVSPQFYSRVYHSFSLGSLFLCTLSLRVTNTDTAAQGSEGANFTVCPFPTCPDVVCRGMRAAPLASPHCRSCTRHPLGCPCQRTAAAAPSHFLSSWKKKSLTEDTSL